MMATALSSAVWQLGTCVAKADATGFIMCGKFVDAAFFAQRICVASPIRSPVVSGDG